MVETRKSRRRSRSDLSDATSTSQGSRRSSPSRKGSENHSPVPRKTVEEEILQVEEAAKEEVLRELEEPVVEQNVNADVEEPSKSVGQSVTAAATKKLPPQKEKRQATAGNPLSKLVPGYVAPLRLTSDVDRAETGLTELRRQALRSDPSNVKSVAGLLVPAAKATSSSYAAVAMSFKKGSKRRKEGIDHAGAGWFGMRSTPMSNELKKDLALIRNRNYLDPKRFYKSADKSGKFVQLGTVIEGASEYYSARLTKKQRRGNLVDDILADPSSSDYAQKKYRNMQQEKTALALKRREGKKGRR